jgi:hypothetical protein
MRPGSSTKEALEHRKRIIEREVSEHRRAAPERAPWPPRSSRLETVVAVGVVLLVLGLGVGGFMYFTSSPNVRAVAKSRVQEAPVAAAPTAPLPVAEVKREPVVNASKEPAQESSGTLLGLDPKRSKPLAADPAPLAKTESAAEREPVPAKAAPARETPRTKPATAKAPEQQPRGKAQLVLAVSPGGEIYIDGKYLGDTPPMTTFDLDPGMYQIEVRSGSRKPFLTYMTVEPGDVRRIRHDFDAKPSRPPG